MSVSPCWIDGIARLDLLLFVSRVISIVVGDGIEPR